MNIVLIGFRGVGKSSIAELVAMCTDRTVFRVDDEVEKRAGYPISEIVSRYGSGNWNPRSAPRPPP